MNTSPEGESKKRGKGKKMKSITFRPDEDVEKFIEEALGATGAPVTKIINDIIRKSMSSWIDNAYEKVAELRRHQKPNGRKD
jgi:hypothetical protein